MRAWHLTGAGSLSGAFDGDGRFEEAAPSAANAVAIDAQPRYWVTGVRNGRMALWRFGDLGADPAFGVVSDPVDLAGTGYGLATLRNADGTVSVYVAGVYEQDSADRPIPWKFTGGGALDASFAGAGSVVLPNSHDSWSTSARAVAVDVPRNEVRVVGLSNYRFLEEKPGSGRIWRVGMDGTDPSRDSVEDYPGSRASAVAIRGEQRVIAGATVGWNNLGARMAV